MQMKSEAYRVKEEEKEEEKNDTACKAKGKQIAEI